MRTTVTLDEDVERAIDRLMRERGESMKTILNGLVRAGLATTDRKRSGRAKFRTRSVDGGRCKLRSLDDVGHVLAVAEGDDHA